jgi:hypothetical protein
MFYEYLRCKSIKGNRKYENIRAQTHCFRYIPPTGAGGNGMSEGSGDVGRGYWQCNALLASGKVDIASGGNLNRPK